VFRITSEVAPGFLTRMLYEAVYWDPDMPRKPLDTLLDEPTLARYVDGWGRPGDDALVAVGLDEQRAGAAWLRQFEPAAPGYAFVDTSTPELSIAVDREHRGRGAGSLLLAGLLGRARARNVSRVSLSVASDNPARSMYERFGFTKIGETATTWTMLIDLSG
jgi:ribosomal protein S18 acetylase RimI-like enzyme